MPFFLYKAKKNSGETVTGRIESQNPDEALELINQMDLVPVSLEEISQGVLVSNIQPRRIKAREVYRFTKQLGGLVKSGVALLKGLEVLSVQTKNPYLSKIIGDIALNVKSGSSFSVALSDYPQIFSSLYISMIQAGEEIGNLREVLLDVAEFQKKQQDLITKVTGAMIYPFVMLAVGLLTGIFILTIVLPKIAVIYAGTSQVLPLPTMIVMKVSGFFRAYWIPLLILVAILTFAINKWRHTIAAKIVVGQVLLRLPVIRDLVIKTDLARFTRTLHLLLNSGLTLVRAIEVSIPTITNPQLKEDLYNCFSGLKSGDSLGHCIKQSVLMPAMIGQMLIVAEESGSLQESLKDIAETYEGDIDESIHVITTMLEPAMILSVGLIVGFIVFAMLMPIFSMDLMAS